MRVVYHPAAVDELVETAEFYDSRVQGLGADFLDEIDQTVSRIAEPPERFAISLHIRHQRRREAWGFVDGGLTVPILRFLARASAGADRKL